MTGGWTTSAEVEGLRNEEVTWAVFREGILEEVLSRRMSSGKKEMEFLRLEQGNMTVN